MEYVERTYRTRVGGKGLAFFGVRYKESDLWIGVDEESFSPRLYHLAFNVLYHHRRLLAAYLARDPGFRHALVPHRLLPGAPRAAARMAAAAARAGLGPMAAVAGAFAEIVGRALGCRAREVIVENGGDIYLKLARPRVVAVFAGESVLSEKVGIRVYPDSGVRGICTSSGTVGPSLSFGRADAAVVVATGAALADAAATGLGNLVRTPDDFLKALAYACGIKGVKGAVVVQGEKLAAQGEIELVPL